MLLKGQVCHICLFKAFNVCAVTDFDELLYFFSVNICESVHKHICACCTDMCICLNMEVSILLSC